MLFYTKYFFKHTRPVFTAPGKIDEEFYNDVKSRLNENPNLKFEPESNFWMSYRIIFFVFLTFIICLSILLLFFKADSHFIFVIPVFLVIGLFQPSVYFLILLAYHLIYLYDERRYHNVFKKAVIDSPDFDTFSRTFYTELGNNGD